MSTKAIVWNTFKEASRNKVFYLLIFLGIFFVFSSRLISMLTIGDSEKVLKDIGLAAIDFFSILIAIFTGINLLYKEIDKKTIFNILSKPISRDYFVIGKFLGLALTMLIALCAMGLIFFAFLLITTGRLDSGLLLYFPLLYFELLIIIAISLLFSSFTTPILSSIFTISLYLIGQITWTFNQFKYMIVKGWVKYLTYFAYYLLPNFDKFNLKNALVMKEAFNPWQPVLALLYALLYIAALLGLTLLIFRRREFQ